MQSLIFDTTFLIDFQRERKQGKEGRTRRFLRNHADKGAFLSMVACGEYAEAFRSFSEPAFLSVVESFELLPVTRKTAEHYAEITSFLRKEGKLIGADDLWIVATAREHRLPLVTDNVDHFGRVPDLCVIGY
jgi:predicted nucleic acid-binding protein